VDGRTELEPVGSARELGDDPPVPTAFPAHVAA